MIEKTEVLAAFCPKEVIYHFAENNAASLTEPLVMDPHECVVMWIDIHKFTSLGEMVSAGYLGSSISELFGELIDVITSHGGDVLKFCGDALLCSFRDAQGVYENEDDGLDAAAVAACSSALEIQGRSFKVGNNTVDLKLSIAYGTIHAMLVGGTQDRWEYLVIGEPLQQIRYADAACEPGQVILSEQALTRLLRVIPVTDFYEVRDSSCRSSNNRRDTASSLSSAISSFSLPLGNTETQGLRRSTHCRTMSALPKPMLFTDVSSEFSSPKSDCNLSTIEPLASIPSPSCSSDIDFEEAPLSMFSSSIDGKTTPGSSEPTLWLKRSPSGFLDLHLADQQVAVPPPLELSEENAKLRRQDSSPSLQTKYFTSPPIQRACSFVDRRRRKTDSTLPRWKPIDATLSRKPSDLSVSNSSVADPVKVFCLRGLGDTNRVVAKLADSHEHILLAFSRNESEKDEERGQIHHPLESFVPYQIRTRLSQLDSICADGYGQSFWTDSAFAEMRYVTVLFIKIHTITEYSFVQDDLLISCCDGSDDECDHELDGELLHPDADLLSLNDISPRGCAKKSKFSKDKGQKLADAIHESLVIIETNLCRYGGMLRQMTCDDKGTVAIGVFGVPGTSSAAQNNLRPDDVSFAVLCALEISAGLRKHEYHFESSIGVATGEAYCGIIGSEKRAEYAIVGDTVNTAARIMGKADPKVCNRAVACDTATKNECQSSSMVQFDPYVQSVAVKNKKDPVMLHYPLFPKEDVLDHSESVLFGQSIAKSIISDIVSPRSVARHANQVVLFQGGHGVGKTALCSHTRSHTHGAKDTTDVCQLSRVYSISCTEEKPVEETNTFYQLRNMYMEILGINAEFEVTWIQGLVEHLSKRSRCLLQYIELLGDLFPEYKETLSKERIGLGLEEPSFESLKDRDVALSCFLVAIFQTHHPFCPVTLAIDNVDFLCKALWPWLVILIATCSMRELSQDDFFPEAELLVPLFPKKVVDEIPHRKKITAEENPQRRKKKRPSLKVDTLAFPSLQPESLPTSTLSRRPRPAPRTSTHRRRSCTAVPDSNIRSFGFVEIDINLVPIPGLDNEPETAPRESKTSDAVESPDGYPMHPTFVRASSSHSDLTVAVDKPSSCRSTFLPWSSGPNFESRFTSWFVSEDSFLSVAAIQYASLFSLFESGPKTLLSVVMTAASQTSKDFDRCLALLKRNHGIGRVSFRQVPLKPLDKDHTSSMFASCLKKTLPACEDVQSAAALTPELVDLVYRFTGGIPRVIELLAEKTFREGFVCFPYGKLWFDPDGFVKAHNNLQRNQGHLFV